MAYTTSEWIRARNQLKSIDIPMLKNISGSREDLQRVRAFIDDAPGTRRCKRLQRALSVYLSPDLREEEYTNVFREVSRLLYEIQTQHADTYELMGVMSGLSNDAVRHFKRGGKNNFKKLVTLRDALKITLEHLLSKTNKDTQE